MSAAWLCQYLLFSESDNVDQTKLSYNLEREKRHNLNLVFFFLYRTRDE